jgi:predicted MPP superfamily phosphohydrolase
MYGLTATSFAGISYGIFSSRMGHELTNVEFPMTNLPEQLHGFSIALVSDIHSSVFMTKHDMDAYVQYVNDLKADLIAVTGDFVNGLTEEVYPFAEAFCNLKAPLGVYGVMGNHDFYAPDPETVAREVDGCGVKLLRNDKVMIQKNGARFYLLGIDDVGSPERAANKMGIAMGPSPLRDLPRILLCHRPYFIQQASEKRMDLVLSGHTHGGQIVFGRLGDVSMTPAALASPYVWGKYRVADTHMYVSRGIGTVGIPVRINCPPEITRITLTKA